MVRPSIQPSSRSRRTKATINTLQGLAAIQFVGFPAGGVAVFIFLKTYPTCRACGRYLRTLLKHKQKFNNQEEFGQYYDTVFRHAVDTDGFAEWMQWQPHEGKTKPGS